MKHFVMKRLRIYNEIITRIDFPTFTNRLIVQNVKVVYFSLQNV